MTNVVFLVFVVASLAIIEVAFQGARWVGARKREALVRRLRAVGEPEMGVQLLRRRRLANRPILDAALTGNNVAERAADLLEQADLDWTAARFLFYTVLYGVATAAILWFVVGNPLFVLAGLGLGGAVPLWAALAARKRRSLRISQQLPEALEMLARSLRAGHALPAAFKLVAQEMAAPIAVEFGKAFEQQNVGVSFEAAVQQMAARVPGNADVAIFAVSVLIQRETGGNLIESLGRIAETIRDRERFYGRLRAITAESRASAMILGALPFVVGLLLLALNPEYVLELAKGEGRLLLGGGLTLWGFGMFSMRKLSQVEY